MNRSQDGNLPHKHKESHQAMINFVSLSSSVKGIAVTATADLPSSANVPLRCAVGLTLFTEL